MRTSLFLLYQDLIVSGRLAAFAAMFFLISGTVLTACLLTFVLLRPNTAYAIQTIPYLVNFQGRLTDNNGNVLSDGSYNVKFRLFNTATGGAALWEEDRDFGGTDNRISVQNGLFNIQLGSLTSLSPALFNEATQGNLYLEVELPSPATATCATNGCAAWTEGAMTPRQPLSASTYAFNSDTLDGIDSSGFVQLDLGSAQTGSVHVSGNLQADGSLQGSTAILTGTGSLTLGSSSALGQITFGDGTDSHITILQSGSTGPPSLTLTLPSAYGSSGDCLKDTSGGGLLGFSSCSSGVTLQTVYDNSSTPALITTSSATKALIIQSGTGNNSTQAFAVIPDGTTTPVLDVDTQNSRVGIGTATPTEALDVAGAVRVGDTTGTNAGAIRFSGGQFEGYNGAAWVALGSAEVLANNFVTVYKTADQSLASSTTLTNDNELKFTIGAGETWDFHMNVSADASTAGDFKIAVTAPSGATCNYGASVAQNTDSYSDLNCGSATGILTGEGNNTLYYVDGYVTAGATGGTVTLQWAQNTASANASIVRAGSYLQAIQDTGGNIALYAQGGNSFGATAVLGTSDAQALSVIAAGTEALHIDTSGNLGIGNITSDGSKLDLNGDLELNGIGAPSVAPSGEGRIYFDSTTGHFRVSESGGSYQDLLGVTGADTALDNLSSVDLNTSLLTSTSNSLNIGSAANPFASAYFGTGVQSPSLVAANNTDLALQSTGTGNLNLSSGSGTVNLAAATIKTTAQASLTFDLNSAVNSTLYVTNSNAGHVANLDVSGSLNLGAGQQISVGGTQISSSNLSDSSSITKQGNSFNGASQLVQTDSSGHLPTLSGQNLTSLNASNLATGSGAVTLQSGGSSGLTLTSASGTISLGSNILQRAGPALTLDLATAGTSQLSILNSNGSNIANLNVSGGLTIGSGQVVTVGSTSGAGVSCSGGQLLQNQVVAGGIVTGGTCAAAGANTTLSNLGTVAANANLSPDATANNRTIGDASHLWADGYFGAALFSPSFTGTGAVSVTSGGTSNLTLDSLSGTLVVGANTTTLQKAANLFTIDLATAGTSTLDLTNSNGSNIANLSVEGGVDIGSGRVYSVNGTTGLSRSCSSGQILDGFTTTGGIITGGTCTSLAGDNLLAAWTSQQATTTTNTQTTINFTGANNSAPSFNNATHVLTLPANASKLVVEVKGGGGGGGSTGTTSAIKAAGGGGEGGDSKLSLLGSLGTNYYFKVGGGGAGGASGGTNNGTAGSASCFGTNSGNACTTPAANAAGGTGGTASNSAASAGGGAGGSAASGIGDTHVGGAPGQSSTSATAGIQSGAGGGQGGGAGLATTAAAGNAGASGGGGSGAIQNTASTTSRAGGAGGDGYLTITVYVPAADTSGGSSSETLQDAYNLSSSNEFTLDSTNGGLTIQDSSGGIGGNLLEVQDNTGSTTYLAVTTAGVSTSGSVSVASGQTYNVGASTGQSSTVSCTTGQAVTAATFTGGILTTAPTCSSVGAGGGAATDLSNIAATAADANISPDATASNRDLGDSSHLWRTGYFGTSLQAPLLTSASGADLTVQSAGTGNLDITSGSGTVNLSATTIATAAQSSLTFDLNDAATTTLFVKNTSGAHVANLDVSGGLNIASGQTYKVGGTQISSANLSDGSSITKQGNSFNGTSQLVQTDGSGNLPALSGQNLTGLNASNLATGTGAVSLASGGSGALNLTSASGTIGIGSATIQRTANALTLDLTTSGASTFTVSNSNGANVANLSVTGSVGIGVGGAYTAGASTGIGVSCSGGQFLQNQTVVGGITTGGTCASGGGGDLQSAYNASSTPADISLANGKDFEVDATDQATDPNILFNLECVTSCSSNGRFAIQDSGTDVFTVSPSGALTVHPTAGQDLSVNLSSASTLAVSSTSAPTSDQVSIDNSATSGVATANANGLHINYLGGGAAVEASGERIDFAPGTTSGGTWNGLKIVAGTTGAASGVSENGLDIVGPTSSGSGTETAVNITTGWDIGLNIDAGGLQLGADTSDPATPANGELRVYAKKIAGRTMLKALGSSGVDYALQPSLFQQNVVLVTGGNSSTNTTYTTLGSPVTASGTLAAQSGSTSEALGNTSRIATGTTAATVAGFFTKNVYYRGSTANGADGYFYFARLNLNGQSLSNYESATTGSRIFAGLCGATFNNCTTSDSPTTSDANGFQLSGTRGDTAFQFLTCNSSACNVINTGVTVANSDTYDLYTYTAPQGATTYWRIDDLTTGAAPVEGSTGTDLPTAGNPMNAGLQIVNVSAANRFLYFQRMYFETDR